jgi:hypothetical protein
VTRTCLVAVSIDVECDKDLHWRVRRPLTFRGVEEGIGRRLAPLFAEYGVRPTYLLSPEVIRDGTCVSLLKTLEACELGTHLHPEFVRSSDHVEITEAVACLMPEEDERRDLDELTSSFTAAFGSHPRSYRAGRFGASGRTIGILGTLGYLVDSSVTPYKKWDYELDFSAAPSAPYFPDLGDISRAGQPGGVLEVPVSLRPSPVPSRLRAPAQLLASTRLGFGRDLAKWARGPAWFRPGWSKRRGLLAFVRAAAAGEYDGVLNMMFHNVDVVLGCSPNARSEETVEAALLDLRRVFEETLARGGRFATLTEIRQSLESRG